MAAVEYLFFSQHTSLGERAVNVPAVSHNTRTIKGLRRSRTNWLHCHKKDHRIAGSGLDRFRVDVSVSAMTDRKLVHRTLFRQLSEMEQLSTTGCQSRQRA